MLSAQCTDARVNIVTKELFVKYPDVNAFADADLKELEQVLDFSIRSIDLGTGTVSVALTFPESLFYEILSARAGMPIENQAQLLELLTTLSQAKAEYDKISDALASVRATGYGIVMPTSEEMTLETPEILKKGNSYGVKLKAGAPTRRSAPWWVTRSSPVT